MESVAPNHRSLLESLASLKAVWYSSPLWLAALLIILSRVDPEVREVVRFMTTSPFTIR